jgi:cytochrome c-type biogenesis protein CcmH/NrfF
MNWLKRFLSREKLYAELDEEIAAHLEERVEELVGEGMSKEEAVGKARKEFGNVTAIKQPAREAWGWKWIEIFLWICDSGCGCRGKIRC